MTQAQRLADLSQAYTAGGVMFRNKLINGSMDLWQRGNNLTFGPFTYLADRWIGAAAGANLSAYVGGGPGGSCPNALAFNGVAGCTYAWVEQRIERYQTRELCQYGLVFSGMLYSATARAFGISIMAPNGSDDWSSETQVHGLTFNHPGGSKYVPFALVVPVVDAKCLNGLACNVGCNGGLVAGEIVGLSQVQCEPGVIQTPFDHHPFGIDVMMAQRYYETGSIYTVGYQPTAGTQQLGVMVYYRVSKRIAPAVTFLRGSQAGAISAAPTTLAFSAVPPDGFCAMYTTTIAGGYNSSEQYFSNAEL